MAPGVAKSYVKNILKVLDIKYSFENIADIDKIKSSLKNYLKEHKLIMNETGKLFIRDLLSKEFTHKQIDEIFVKAERMTANDTYQAMEALIHNFNTMHCLPYEEKIWVHDRKTNQLYAKEIGWVVENYEPKRFKAISVNQKNGRLEDKYIIMAQRKDNHRDLVTVETEFGTTVTVTTNHRVMTLNDGIIDAKYPKETETILASYHDNIVYAIKNNKEKSDEYMYSLLCCERKKDVFSANIIKKTYSNSKDGYVYDISVEDNENFMTESGLIVHNSRAGRMTACTMGNLRYCEYK